MYAAAVLNTITNLGSSWPGTLALALVDPATLRACELGGAGEDEGLTDAQTHTGVVEGLGRCAHGLGLVLAVVGCWGLTAGVVLAAAATATSRTRRRPSRRRLAPRRAAAAVRNSQRSPLKAEPLR